MDAAIFVFKCIQTGLWIMTSTFTLYMQCETTSFSNTLKAASVSGISKWITEKQVLGYMQHKIRRAFRVFSIFCLISCRNIPHCLCIIALTLCLLVYVCVCVPVCINSHGLKSDLLKHRNDLTDLQQSQAWA